MRKSLKSLPSLGASALALTLIAGCGQAKEDTTAPLDSKVNETVVTLDGVPGGVATRVAKMEAMVAEIDYEKRSVSLEDDKGNRRTITVGPEVVNFDQVSKGDKVVIEYVEEQVVYVNDVDEHSEDSVAVAEAVAAEGEVPGAMAVEVVEVVATVSAVDLESHTATLTFSDGTTVVQAVRPDVELLESHVGREVVIKHTTAMAIAVEKM
ncbi:hypothetical protein A3767_13000 [Oleiphilus sp. HI0133]|nr:hypothetical protein A3767_13000 [Oleiphilus sp. HI0133]